jgi:hypothetical protein
VLRDDRRTKGLEFDKNDPMMATKERTSALKEKHDTLSEDEDKFKDRDPEKIRAANDSAFFY